MEYELNITLNSGAWVGNEFVASVVTPQGTHFHVIDASANILREFSKPSDWYIYAPVTPIPNTRRVLLNALPSIVPGRVPVNFLTLDIDTGEYNVLPYTALNGRDYPGVAHLSFSPHGQYLLYGNTRRALINFATGQFIDELPIVAGWGWVGENTLIVQGSTNEGDPLEIARIEPTTGQDVQLLSGAAAEGILLVP